MKFLRVILPFSAVLLIVVSLIGCSNNPTGGGTMIPNNNINKGGNLPGGVIGVASGGINLGTAGDFVIMSKSGIDDASGDSAVTGDMGVSPIGHAAVTGFSTYHEDGSNEFWTASNVVGKIYCSDNVPPTPAKMTAAVHDMETAYNVAAGRTTPAPVTELGAGDISGLTITPGLYKWGTGVDINTDVYLSGSANDVWIFQISQGITLATGAKVHLIGGAKAENVYWQAFGAVTINAGAHMEGTILAKTNIAMKAGATINGRLLAQTAVTLITNTVTKP
jgi:hypothetical protein